MATNNRRKQMEEGTSMWNLFLELAMKGQMNSWMRLSSARMKAECKQNIQYGN